MVYKPTAVIWMMQLMWPKKSCLDDPSRSHIIPFARHARWAPKVRVWMTQGPKAQRAPDHERAQKFEAKGTSNMNRGNVVWSR